MFDYAEDNERKHSVFDDYKERLVDRWVSGVESDCRRQRVEPSGIPPILNMLRQAANGEMADGLSMAKMYLEETHVRVPDIPKLNPAHLLHERRYGTPLLHSDLRVGMRVTIATPPRFAGRRESSSSDWVAKAALCGVIGVVVNLDELPAYLFPGERVGKRFTQARIAVLRPEDTDVVEWIFNTCTDAQAAVEKGLLRSVRWSADAFVGLTERAEVVRQHARVSAQLVRLHARRAALSLLHTITPSIEPNAADAAAAEEDASAMQQPPQLPVDFFAMLELAAADTPLEMVLEGPAAFVAKIPAYAFVAKGVHGVSHSTLSVLAEKCSELFATSAEFGIETSREISLTGADALSLHTEAAHGIIVHFVHDETHLGPVCLSAYGNEELTMRLGRWTATKSAMAPLVASGSHVWMRLEASSPEQLSSAHCKMVISPMHVAFVSAVAIVEFILADIEDSSTTTVDGTDQLGPARASVVVELFNLLIEHVYRSRASEPVRAMLYGLITRIATLKIDRPTLRLPLQRVDPLLIELKYLYDNQRSTISSYFHALIELMTMVRLALGASKLQLPWADGAALADAAEVAEAADAAGKSSDEAATAEVDAALSMPIPIKRIDSVLSSESWPPWLDQICAVTEVIRLMTASDIDADGSFGEHSRILWKSLVRSAAAAEMAHPNAPYDRMLVINNIVASSDHDAVESVLTLLNECDVSVHRRAQGVLVADCEADAPLRTVICEMIADVTDAQVAAVQAKLNRSAATAEGEPSSLVPNAIALNRSEFKSARLSAQFPSFATQADAIASQELSRWSPAQNLKVVHCINELCISCGVKSATDVAPSLLGSNEIDLVALGCEAREARLRMRIVQQLNVEIKEVLRFLNLSRIESDASSFSFSSESESGAEGGGSSRGEGPRTVRDIIASGRGLILTTVKKTLLDSALTHTALRRSNEQKPEVKIMTEGARLGSAATVFEQAAAALRGVPDHILRSRRPPNKSGLFPGLSVSFEDEDAVGDEGPYLQLFSTISEEVADITVSDILFYTFLFLCCSRPHPPLSPPSTHTHHSTATLQKESRLAMFTATPSSVESSERTLVPLPSACGAKELAAFEFLGRLVGIALRTGATLPLNMPRVVWKRLVRVSSPVCSRFSLSFTHTARTSVPRVVGILTHFLPTTQTHTYTQVGQRLAERDLKGVDDAFLARINGVAQPSSEEEWEALQSGPDAVRWTVRLSDRTESALIAPPSTKASSSVESPSSSSALVPFVLRDEWRRQAIDARLHESPLQIDALRRGFTAIVPPSILSLLTARELEHWTSGRPTIDIEMLRRHTEYEEHLSASDPHIKFFWSTLESFDQESRRQWILFSRATSRLPCSDEAWGTARMKIMKSPHDDDAHMPTASTCFFNVYLPRYSTLVVCTEKMRAAMSQCASMSLDT
jgi:hypothetical protein